MGAYSKIFKQAYEITRTNRFLWIFGLFLSLWTTFFIRNEDLQIRLHWSVLVILGAIIVILYFRSKVSLMVAIKAILDKHQISGRAAFSRSRFFYPQVLGIYLLTEITVGLLAGVIGIPIQSMFESQRNNAGVSFLVIGLLIFIPIAVTAALINVLAPLFIVMYEVKSREAIKRSLDLISAQWQSLAVFGLAMFLPQFLVLLASVPVVFLAKLQYHMVGFIGVIIGALILWFVHGLIMVFQQTAWILLFQDLVRPQKIEESEPVVAPEIVS